MVLGRPVYNDRGDVLLARGVALTPGYIKSLRDHGFLAVHVLDGVADDLEPPDILSESVRVATYKHVRSLFAVASSAAAIRGVPDRRARLERFASDAMPLVDELYRDVQRIIDEVMNAELLCGVVSLKSHDSYTFDHSIDVTVVGVVLGQRLRLSSRELHQLALGCIYHDIGKLVIPTSVLGKPGRLSASEFALVQEHPQAGYDMVRRITQSTDLIARHVVWQHHERQDGTGYPRHLRGLNQFRYDPHEHYGRGIILPAAEIAAVADVYSALASDRPYRPALSPPDIVATLRRAGGSQLNREILSRFLSILPSFPVGTEVVVMGGELGGYRGVVSAVGREDIHRPTVRLLFDPTGARITPFEVNTSQERAVNLAVPTWRETALATPS